MCPYSRPAKIMKGHAVWKCALMPGMPANHWQVATRLLPSPWACKMRSCVHGQCWQLHSSRQLSLCGLFGLHTTSPQTCGIRLRSVSVPRPAHFILGGWEELNCAQQCQSFRCAGTVATLSAACVSCRPGRGQHGEERPAAAAHHLHLHKHLLLWS